ncbi:MAG: PAS domain-containing protein, partial [bacterium]
MSDMNGKDGFVDAQRCLSIINSQLDFVCRYTPDLTITFVNDAIYRFFGCPQEQLVGQQLLTLFPSIDQVTFSQHLQQITFDAPDAETEFNAVAHTGVDHWLQWCDHGIFDDAGQLVEYQAVGRDITTHKYMEAQLHEREERYHAIISNAAMGICLIDAFGQFLECNPAFVQMTGYLPAELSMLTLSQVTYPADWAKEQQQFHPLWENDATGYSLEKRLVTKENSLLWTQAMTTLIRDASDRPQYVVQLLEDISVRKEAERIRSEYA